MKRYPEYQEEGDGFGSHVNCQNQNSQNSKWQ